VTSLSPPTLALRSPHSRKWGATWEARDNSSAKARKESVTCARGKSFTLGRNVNSTKHGILRESKESTFATDPHTLKALQDLMQSQEVCTRVGSHNSHSKTTPAGAAMGDASVSYEFTRLCVFMHVSYEFMRVSFVFL